MLITPRHRRRYEHYYEAKGQSPQRPHAWQPAVDALVLEHGGWRVLDYGCGPQAILSHYASYPVQNYDPAVPAYAAAPAPTDLVVCWHVLENVEQHRLTTVLAHIETLACRAILCAVSCVPSTKVLPDGTPWHTIVREPAWWDATLQAAWAGFEATHGLAAAQPETEYRALFVRRRNDDG
jgi:hypothetical protein